MNAFHMTEIRVSKNGGDADTVQAALEILPQEGPAKIVISDGVYTEKVRITRANTWIIGENRDTTIIRYDDHARRLLPDGEPMNTFNSYTLYAGAENIRIENCTIENSAGSGKLVGQAIALYADGDRQYYKNVRLLGNQDTLFTGALPRNPTPKGINLIHPVLGLEGGEYTLPVRMLFEDCYIEGDIDFIFGSATACFNRCEIFSKDRGEEINGYVTAASTPPAYAFGYVFRDCRLTGNARKESVYLGRPWRDHANVIFIDCELGEHIRAEGWDNWDLPRREATTCYREIGSSGKGASGKRAAWAKPVSAAEAAGITIEAVVSGEDGWVAERMFG
jgi:pectinesterase